MDAAQILKPFANEHIPADTKETATAEHTSEIITMQNVNKSYKMGSGSLHVLKDISLTVEPITLTVWRSKRQRKKN